MNIEIFDRETPEENGPRFPRKKNSAPPPEKKKRRIWKRLFLWGGLFLFLLAIPVVVGVVYELRTSRFQAEYITRLARQCTYRLEPGPGQGIPFPTAGPYDERLGFVGLPVFIDRLTAAGYDVTEQARWSPMLLEVANRGFFPVYREKSQAGLRITGHQGRELFAASYPERVHPDFNAIPDIAVQTLLFIENRELLDTRFPRRNPAVEWDRLVKAVLELGWRFVDPDRNVPGGSTLATQIEKYRHSPQGQTVSVRDKLGQMVSASLRAYLDGEETLPARRQIVLNFINSMPLGAAPGYGEISGLGDGMFAWYGADFAATTRCLAARPASGDDPTLSNWARTLKQVVSLFVAQRRPSYYLLEDRAALEAKTNSHLRIMAEAGLIRPWERDAALQQVLIFQTRPVGQEKISFVERKAVNAVRTTLLSLLGLQQFYQLNHLDLSVKSTLNQQVQQEVTSRLRQLNEPKAAEAAGLRAFRLLEKSDPSRVIYSFTLYERTKNANLLRIQTDNFDQPLDINAGIKLELGSSAKLRTLISYLEIIAVLHERYAQKPREELEAVLIPAGDHLSNWAVGYLLNADDKGLAAMLEAAMERRYSASPDEQFFTGGGEHTFVNFDDKDDNTIFSVRDAMRNSINLVFIRIMRDIIHYYTYQIPGVRELLDDASDPRRQEYLARFADQEGAIFLQRFYKKYRGKKFEEALASLLQGIHATPSRLAAVFRYVKPEADCPEFAAFLRAHFPEAALTEQTVDKLFREYAAEAWSLVDRGYIARIHPLELWTIAFLRLHPAAGWQEIRQASVEERQVVYTWLFKTSRKNKQNSKIRSMLEMEAFQELHADWKRLRYPFDSLVPSYATAIGSSADRPAALAELVGIVLNDGVWTPAIRVEELHFAQGTPYETVLQYQNRPSEQVLAPEVARVTREALLGVVTDGTARRVLNAFQQPDGTPVAVGGKTGTGDNRYETYGSAGQLLSSRVINRTAVFVFFLGDRFFGVITAYVAAPAAADYGFTSALPVQVLKSLAPALMPLLAEERDTEEGGLQPNIKPDFLGDRKE